MGGVKIEATVRINAPTSQAYLPQELNWPGTIIAGDNAFSFSVRGSLLFGVFRGTSTWPLQTTDWIDSYSDAVNFQPYNVPVGQWFTMGFVHDGLDTMELSVNGQVIARKRGLLAAVPGVGTGGVSIGNSGANRPNHLNGDIDEIKVWRMRPPGADHELEPPAVAGPSILFREMLCVICACVLDNCPLSAGFSMDANCDQEICRALLSCDLCLGDPDRSGSCRRS